MVTDINAISLVGSVCDYKDKVVHILEYMWSRGNGYEESKKIKKYNCNRRFD